jgi:hypothetical protein
MGAYKPLLLLAFLALFLYGASDELRKPPVPREIAKNHSQKPDVQKNAAEYKNKNVSPVIKGEQKEATKPTEQDKRETQSITVSPVDINSIKLGPLNISKHWSDYATVVFSLLLIVVGYLQWRAIYGQIHLERPWMMFRPSDPNLWPFSNALNPNQPLLTVNWNIINVGRSPAFLTRLVPRMEIMKRNETPPKLPRDTDFPNYIISPKSPPEDRHGTELRRIISQGEYNDLQNGMRRLWVYGVVKYRGIKRRRHTTRFCCLWYVENGVARYDPVGPRGWTKYT